MLVSTASTSGAALASLLQSVATATTYFDGLILGTVHERTVKQQTDTSESNVLTSREAHITGFCCFAGLGSFYNPAGVIDEAQLQRLCAQVEEPVLGWFSYRQGASLAPSLREQAVTLALPHLLQSHMTDTSAGGSPPSVLFAVAATQALHGGATTSFQHQLYQLCDDPHQQGVPPLQSLRLTVSNLGAAALGNRAYDAVSSASPASPFASLPAAPAAPSTSRASAAKSPADAHGLEQYQTEEAAVAAALAELEATSQRQVAAVEGVYQRMHTQVQACAPGVSQRMAALQRQSAAVAELRHQLLGAAE